MALELIDSRRAAREAAAAAARGAVAGTHREALSYGRPLRTPGGSPRQYGRGIVDCLTAEAGSPYGARGGPAWRSAALVARPEAQVRPSLRRFVPGATAERSSLVLYP